MRAKHAASMSTVALNMSQEQKYVYTQSESQRFSLETSV